LDVTVDLSYSGTATNLSDYTRSGISILIPAGSLSGTVTLTAVQDTIDETNETVVVDITGVTNGTESGTQQVTATISCWHSHRDCHFISGIRAGCDG
jgi:hypothetical protein